MIAATRGSHGWGWRQLPMTSTGVPGSFVGGALAPPKFVDQVPAALLYPIAEPYRESKQPNAQPSSANLSNTLSASPSFPEESRPNASSASDDLVTDFTDFIELGEFGEFLELIKSNMTRFLAYDPADATLKYFDDTVRGADETGVYVNKISESTIKVINSTLLRCDVLYDVFAFDPVIDSRSIDSRSIDSSVLKTLKYNFMAAADRSYEITKGAVNGAVNGAVAYKCTETETSNAEENTSLDQPHDSESEERNREELMDILNNARVPRSDVASSLSDYYDEIQPQVVNDEPLNLDLELDLKYLSILSLKSIPNSLKEQDKVTVSVLFDETNTEIQILYGNITILAKYTPSDFPFPPSDLPSPQLEPQPQLGGQGRAPQRRDPHPRRLGDVKPRKGGRST